MSDCNNNKLLLLGCVGGITHFFFVFTLQEEKGFPLCLLFFLFITGTLASDWFQAHRWVSHMCVRERDLVLHNCYLTATRTLVESSSAIAAAAVIMGCKDDWVQHTTTTYRRKTKKTHVLPPRFRFIIMHSKKKNSTFDHSSVTDELQVLKRIFKY